MKRQSSAVIDLCSDSSDDDEAKLRSIHNETNRTITNDAAIDRQRGAKRPKAEKGIGGTATSASSTPHTANAVPLIFLKSDDGATLTVVNSDDCKCCFTPKTASTMDDNRLSMLGTTHQPLIHIHQPDRWSCGFRNWQMLLCFLVPRLMPDHSFFQSSITTEFSQDFYQIPSVRDLQTAMEQSWANGFDLNGALHYQRKILGKRMWIGALEVWGCLTFMGIDCIVVQFIHCPQSRQELGPFCLRYFTAKETNGCHECGARRSARATASCLLGNRPLDAECSCACGRKLPLYLQWEGHSVTAIGVEKTAKGNNLLVLNPSKSNTMIENAIRQKKLAPFRIPFSQLHKKDTQILLPSLYHLSEVEQERLKGKVDPITAAHEHVQRACRQKLS